MNGDDSNQVDMAENDDTMSKASSNHLKQKRARSQLSCTPCRQGKLKCNRQQHPACDQCIKRNRESACLFVPPPAKHKPAQNVKGRIRQLESLVVDLMNQNRGPGQNSDTEEARRSSSGAAQNGAYSQPTPPSDNDRDTTPPSTTDRSQRSRESTDDIDAATTPFGQMKISKNEISYVGESHWGAILNSISDLKRDLGEEGEAEDDGDGSPESTINSWGTVSVPMGGVQPHATTGLGFMLGNSSPVTKDQLISSVPEKKTADRLLSLWFNSPDPFKPIIHAPTFQDEYKRFWRSPNEAPVTWLGLFYAILSLAASFGLRDNDPGSPQAQAVLQEVNKYHSLSASAAVLGDFTKPKQYTLECLILYAAGLRSNNAFVNVWLMIGLVLRLALRMGYHRDPSHYPAISIFQGEMRRRVWAIISMIDVLISFQLGLPSMVKTIQADTQPPRNLLDRDFTSSTKVLPTSRDIDELTPSSYTRAKLRIVRIFADASELSHATITPPQEEAMCLDGKLEEAKAAIPPLLQMPDISELVTDPAEQLMCRFNIDLLYLKTKIVLHRRWMLTPYPQLSPEEQKRGIGLSRRACIMSALRVLQHHHTIYTASQNGGQLESVKWYMGSISTHDFLLAAMVICLELNSQLNNPAFRNTPSGLQCPHRRAMMDALEKSSRIWSDSSGRKRKQVQFTGKDDLQKGEHMFDETEKAGRAMAVMLEKVRTQMTPMSPEAQNNDAPTPINKQSDGTSVPSYNSSEPSTGNYSPFNGVISNYEWGSVAGIPDNFDMQDQQAFFTHTGPSDGMAMQPMNFGDGMSNLSQTQTQTSGTTPSQGLNQPDFSMIGDMLDGPVNLDWEMWDNEVIGRQPNFESFQQDADLSAFDMQSGNVANGGSGRVHLPIVPGNVVYPNGTGPTGNNFSGMDFSMEPMNEADFNLYNPAIGMWPTMASGNGDPNPLGSGATV